ncbi:hypothetical protein IQ07DRAFT_590946 [Pyrenochaeta sp. DS3sAY3a]|nr:hypothetical protein IQ07DRAFT_590946 [Pyrenochaeta sp. DS3sAY3a]
MDDTKAKRKAEPDARDERHSKKAKGKKNWEMPRKKDKLRTIQPGDSGIWATCAMNKEAKSVGDLRDLFQEYATKLYGATNGSTEADGSDSDSDGGDIEAEINKEIANIRKPSTKPLFTSIKLDTQCLVFFRTRQPVEPVSFVHRICQDIADGAQFGNLRYVKRLTPMTAYEKATLQGLDTVAKRVLAPHFHEPDQTGKKFAIRPSIRNNKEFKRDQIIKSVAAAVGPGHKVDLRGYDLLILVEIYQNVIGMSVVGPDFEKLKRFNLEELRQPVPTTEPKPKETIVIKEDN